VGGLTESNKAEYRYPYATETREIAARCTQFGVSQGPGPTLTLCTFASTSGYFHLMDAKSLALTTLGRMLQSRGYRFVAVTPATHCRVLDRAEGPTTLESIFGWNRPFDPDAIEEDIFELLEDAEALEAVSGRYKSKLRFATIGDLLFVHSGFPTAEPDAVFFGPDTYRFVRLLRQRLGDLVDGGPVTLVDVGCGSGAGGLYAARLLGPATRLVLADINREALSLGAVNAVLNDIPSCRTIPSDVLSGVEGTPDVIVANAPYLVDDGTRLHPHGGGELGISLALRVAEESLARLTPGGRLVLYSGTPIISGADPLLESLRPLLERHASEFNYEEIDVDVFGEELDRSAYAEADRIAVIGLTAIKRG
jgi:methylase of polypeptide subunit release factors